MPLQINSILSQIPRFKKYYSVEKLYKLVSALSGNRKMSVTIVGYSENGLPIHHIRCGMGSVKVLYVGFPHVDEPVGGLTVASLLTLLQNNCKELFELDVEWNIIPCIDPDGAQLNEQWTQKEFTLSYFVKHFYKQPGEGQVDGNFPVDYKKLQVNNPNKEAQALMKVLDAVRPDFCHHLHNAMIGGTYFLISKPIDSECCDRLKQLATDNDLVLQLSSVHSDTSYGDAVFPLRNEKTDYDRIAKSYEGDPTDYVQHSMGFDCYLESIGCHHTVTLLSEVPYVSVKCADSNALTELNLKRLMLRSDADSQYLVSCAVEEWEKVSTDLDVKHRFYKNIAPCIAQAKINLHDGIPGWTMLYTTKSLLENTSVNRLATDSEMFSYAIRKPLGVLCSYYGFITLMKESKQSDAIKSAIPRMKKIFDDFLLEKIDEIEAVGATTNDINALVRTQFGSGLIVLDSIIKRKKNHANTAFKVSK